MHNYKLTSDERQGMGEMKNNIIQWIISGQAMSINLMAISILRQKRESFLMKSLLIITMF